MLILRKFVCTCLGLGAITSGCLLLLQMPIANSPSGAKSASSIAGNALIQLASAQADSFYREASAKLAPSLKSFTIASGAFVRSNAITARLQFEGMVNSFPRAFAINDWMPRNTPYWTKSGVAGIVQASDGQAKILSTKIPVVRSVKSNLARLVEMHP
jgi:hypothetical protein